MKIKVLYFGNFRQITGVKQKAYNIKEPASLYDLIAYLIEKYGVSFRDVVKNTPGLRILINGRENIILDGMNTALEDGNIVVILPPVVGG